MRITPPSRGLARMLGIWGVAGLGIAALTAGGSAALASGTATGHSQETLTCNNGFGMVTVSVPNANQPDQAKGSWSVGQVVSSNGEHGIPTSFSFSVVDLTTGHPVFSFTKTQAGGHSHPNQTLTTCTETQMGTFSQLAGPGATPPPGVSPTDTLRQTITVTVIVKVPGHSS